MSNINNTVLSGRLTSDPKLYETSGENVYALLHLAINEERRNGGHRAIYYDVKAWNGLASACVKHLRKGGHVVVQGRLDQYDNPETKERWNFISAERVEFGARPKAGSKAAESGVAE